MDETIVTPLGKDELALIVDQQIKALLQKDGGQPDQVEMEAAKGGILDGLADIKVLDIPIGSVAAGMGIAAVVTEIVNGLFARASIDNETWAKYGGAVVDLGSAYAVNRWGKKRLGKNVTDTTVLLLTFHALQQLLPIDQWIRDLLPFSHSTGFGAGAKKISSKYRPIDTGSVQTQANQVVNDYYAGLAGGR